VVGVKAVIPVDQAAEIDGTTNSVRGAGALAPAAEAAYGTWSVGPIDFSGLVDGYLQLNSNHPASQVNQLYNFNDKTTSSA